jgi:hypothetical protein
MSEADSRAHRPFHAGVTTGDWSAFPAGFAPTR